jgi:hypothetical protein
MRELQLREGGRGTNTMKPRQGLVRTEITLVLFFECTALLQYEF